MQQLLASENVRPKELFERMFMLKTAKRPVTLNPHHPVALAELSFAAAPPESPFKSWHVFGYHGDAESLDLSAYTLPLPLDANGGVIAQDVIPKRIFFATNNHNSLLQINDCCYTFKKLDCKPQTFLFLLLVQRLFHKLIGSKIKLNDVPVDIREVVILSPKYLLVMLHDQDETVLISTGKNPLKDPVKMTKFFKIA